MIVDPAERIVYVVRAVSGALTQELERALRPVRLTQIQLGVLVMPGREGELTTAELARRCGVGAR